MAASFLRRPHREAGKIGALHSLHALGPGPGCSGTAVAGAGIVQKMQTLECRRVRLDLQEYEVACMVAEKDRVTLRIREVKWSVFRRYSEFVDLDK